jgi:hypothetical protein
MGRTPKRSLPYPEPSDSPDVPRDIKALADKLDDQPRLRVLPIKRVDTDGNGDVVLDISPPLDRPPSTVLLASSGDKGSVEGIKFVFYSALCTESQLQFGVWKGNGARFVGNINVSGIVSY